ncbi:hypothetical protein BDN72DRAFT_388022 [Pluteus cervinus]|uniref:Uncharacterized protein n=1 Tax=Pluteus cervinus TaxID=181527 RepID=A0ACD3B1W0_9AGAR|nr:hypothetical protein BDN72DRAFT_388022 [Pluteus cervinus]
MHAPQSGGILSCEKARLDKRFQDTREKKASYAAKLRRFITSQVGLVRRDPRYSRQEGDPGAQRYCIPWTQGPLKEGSLSLNSIHQDIQIAAFALTYRITGERLPFLKSVCLQFSFAFSKVIVLFLTWIVHVSLKRYYGLEWCLLTHIDPGDYLLSSRVFTLTFS